MSYKNPPKVHPIDLLESSHPKVMFSNHWRSFGWWEMMLSLISGSLPSSWPDSHFKGLIVWYEQALEIVNDIKKRQFEERNMRIQNTSYMPWPCARMCADPRKSLTKTSVPSTLPTTDISRVKAEIYWEPPVLAQQTDGWGPARRLEALGVTSL